VKSLVCRSLISWYERPQIDYASEIRLCDVYVDGIGCEQIEMYALSVGGCRCDQGDEAEGCELRLGGLGGAQAACT